MSSAYNKLSDLIELTGGITSEFGSIKSATDDIFLRHLQTIKSGSGSISSFYLDIVLLNSKEISFDVLGGFGIEISGIPITGSPESYLPTSLSINWPILKFLNNFKLNNFANSKFEIIEVIKSYFGLKVNASLQSIFLSDKQDLNSLVDEINTEYGINISLNNSLPNKLEIVTDLFQSLESANIDQDKLIFDIFFKNLQLTDFSMKIRELFKVNLETDNINHFINDLIVPKFNFSLGGFTASILTPNGLFKRVDDTTHEYLIDPITTEVIRGKIIIEIGSLSISSENGIQFGTTLSGSMELCEILNTGILVEFDGIGFGGLGAQKGNPSGLYIEECGITLSKKRWVINSASTAELRGRGIFISKSGFSGNVSLEAVGATQNPVYLVNFGSSLIASLTSFNLGFRNNKIINSQILGKLKVPNFKDVNGNDAEIDIDVSIGTDGEFRVTATETDGVQLLEIPNILKISVNSLELGKKNNKFYVAISGKLDIIASVEGISTNLPKNIGIKKLLIWDDGKIEIEGGALTLPKAVTVKIGPVKLSVSAIHLGSHEQQHGGQLRKYNFFGFDGALDINPGGVSASGNGVKFFYTIDNDTVLGKNLHAFIRVDEIGIDIKIPSDAKSAEEAQLLLKGYLAVKNAPPTNAEDGTADPGREYIGSVAFAINKASIRGQAGMRLNPDKPSFIVDVGLNLATPIPLGTTGLGIWGFRGLFGKQYLPDRQNEESWWQYYKRPDEGINVKKFKSVDKGFSVGVGALIATKDDKGRAFSSKVFLMLGLPDVFLISGQAAILKDRVGFESNDPPFSALIAISKESVIANFGVNYKSPEEGSEMGKTISINGEAELAFFFNNASGWYINIGQDTPDTARIQARVLSLFDMYAYLMISAKGIKMGAGARYEFSKKYGPVQISAHAFIDLAARVGFKPSMLGGSIALGGGVKASLFGISLSFDVFAMLAAETWKPFIVTGAFDLNIKVPLKRDPINVHAELTWIFNREKDLTPFEILNVSSIDTKSVKAVHMLTEQSFDLALAENNSAGDTENWMNSSASPIIPMDSFIDIELSNSVINLTTENPTNGLFKIYGNVQGVNYITMVPPIKGKTQQVKHESEILELKINYLNGGNWETYFPYKFIKDLENVSGFNLDLDKIPAAYWQMLSEGKNNRLRILSQNMFSTIQKAVKGTISLEGLGFKGGIITCEQDSIKNECINWEEVLDSTVYTKDKYHYHKGIKLISHGGDFEVKTQSNNFNLNKGIEFQDSEILDLLLPEPSSKIKPKISTIGNNKVIITYYEKVVTSQDHNGFDVEEFEVAKVDEVQGSALDTYTGYDDINRPIEKITIQVIVSTAAISSNTSDLYIGNELGWRDEFSIDDVKFYMRDISINEINQLYNGNSVEKGLVLDLKLDNNLTDSSPLNNTTSYSIGNPTFTKDKDLNSNKAIYFNGHMGNWNPPSGCIKVDSVAELSLDEESYSVSFWFKGIPMTSWNYSLSYSGTKIYYPIINKGFFDIYGIYHYSINNHGTFCGIIFRKSVNGKFDTVKGARAENKGIGMHSYYSHVLDGDWHHVVVRCNHKTGILEMYIDNKLVDSTVPSTDYNIISHNAYLHEICYLTKEKHTFNIGIPSQSEIDEETQKMQNVLEKAVQPVWRPNTKYFIELKTNDKVNGSDNIKYYKVGFETDGPTGHFHEHDPVFTALELEKREDEYAIATLKPYINYESSYPNPDGQLNMAKPLFFKTPKLKLFFNDGYTYALFNEWKDGGGNVIFDTNLKLTVKDSEESSNISALEGTWVEMDGLNKSGMDGIILNNIIANGPNCSNLNLNIERKSYYAEFVLPDLMPRKLYTSIYDANNKIGGNDELKRVHNHVFTTSRYGDFEEQIQSFVMGVDGGTQILAKFTLELTLDIDDLTLATTIVNTPASTSEEIQKEFPMIFDRLMDGALKTTAFDDSVCTEITVIKDITSNTLIGLLIRNPEPFFDPRINVQTLESNHNIKPIEIFIDNGSTSIPIDKLVYSHDKSKVFATVSSLSLPTGSVSVDFKYPEFDGANYIVNEQIESIEFNISN